LQRFEQYWQVCDERIQEILAIAYLRDSVTASGECEVSRPVIKLDPVRLQGWFAWWLVGPLMFYLPGKAPASNDVETVLARRLFYVCSMESVDDGVNPRRSFRGVRAIDRVQVDAEIWIGFAEDVSDPVEEIGIL
jgi:hypothetical protein